MPHAVTRRGDRCEYLAWIRGEAFVVRWRVGDEDRMRDAIDRWVDGDLPFRLCDRERAILHIAMYTGLRPRPRRCGFLRRHLWEIIALASVSAMVGATVLRWLF